MRHTLTAVRSHQVRVVGDQSTDTAEVTDHYGVKAVDGKLLTELHIVHGISLKEEDWTFFYKD